VEIFIFAIAIGLIPASIAHNKGRDFVSWWLFGTLLWIVAMPLAIIAKPALVAEVNPIAVRPCLACSGPMPRAAPRCPACGSPSEPWQFQAGRWWIAGPGEKWYWLDEHQKEWVLSGSTQRGVDSSTRAADPSQRELPPQEVNPASLASRPCPSCNRLIERTSSTCGECGTISEPWFIRDGLWWTVGRDGEEDYLIEGTSIWVNPHRRRRAIRRNFIVAGILGLIWIGAVAAIAITQQRSAASAADKVAEQDCLATWLFCIRVNGLWKADDQKNRVRVNVFIQKSFVSPSSDDGFFCHGVGTFSGVTEGLSVQIIEPEGSYVASTSLGQGRMAGGSCAWTAYLDSMRRKDRYRIEFGELASIDFTLPEILAKNLKLDLIIDDQPPR